MDDSGKEVDYSVNDKLETPYPSLPPSPSPSLPTLDSQDDLLSSCWCQDNDERSEVDPVDDQDESIRFDTASPIHEVWTPDDPHDMLRACFLPISLAKAVSPDVAPMSPSITDSETDADYARPKDCASDGSSLGSDTIFPNTAWPSWTAVASDADC
jgi:hypothetical protein